MIHIPIQAIGNYNTLWFWYMVPEPHGCLYIELYFLIILFQVTIYFQYVHDYFNVHLRCCVLCHYYMFYGRSRFYCILIVYAKFFMFTLFLLYLVRNDNNKDDQSINVIAISSITSFICDQNIVKVRDTQAHVNKHIWPLGKLNLCSSIYLLRSILSSGNHIFDKVFGILWYVSVNNTAWNNILLQIMCLSSLGTSSIGKNILRYYHA